MFSTRPRAVGYRVRDPIKPHPQPIHDLHKNSKSAMLREDIFRSRGRRIGELYVFEGFGSFRMRT